MSRSTTSYIIRLFVLVVSMVLIGADLTVSAQNTNSSTTTTPEDTSTQNTNMSNMNMNRGGRRRRRGRRRGGNTMNANTSGDMQENANTADAMQDNANMANEAPGNMNMGGRRRRGRRRGGNMNAAELAGADTATTIPVRTGRCDPNAQEQTDLSGTYTGTVNYTEGGLSGDTTLTVSGNDFTMTTGSTTQEGRIVAVTTCNYTAVTMMLGKVQTSAATGTQPPPLPAVSLRARRIGGGLTLESVEGESRQFSFTSAGTGGGGGGVRRPRGRRGRRMAAPRRVGIKPPTATSHTH